jgi:hypothetical protein
VGQRSVREQVAAGNWGFDIRYLPKGRVYLRSDALSGLQKGVPVWINGGV